MITPHHDVVQPLKVVKISHLTWGGWLVAMVHNIPSPYLHHQNVLILKLVWHDVLMKTFSWLLLFPNTRVVDMMSESIYACILLAYKVKTQYVQISNIIDTSSKRPISGQSTPMVKDCMDIMYDMTDTDFSYWRALIVCSFLHESSKVTESNLYVIWNTHTAFLLCRAQMLTLNIYTFISKLSFYM